MINAAIAKRSGVGFGIWARSSLDERRCFVCERGLLNGLNAPRSDLPAIRANCIKRLAEVQAELARSAVHRELWTAMRDAILERFPRASPTFINAYSQSYAQFQAMTVRRMVDTDPRPWSLWQLYERFRANPSLLNRAEYVNECEAHARTHSQDWSFDRNEADVRFTRHFGSGPTADPAIIAQHQSDLRDRSARITEYADRTVAHRDPTADSFDLTFAEIHEALDFIAESVNRLHLFLEHVSVMYQHTVVPAGWREPFMDSLFPLPPIDPSWPPT